MHVEYSECKNVASKWTNQIREEQFGAVAMAHAAKTRWVRD